MEHSNRIMGIAHTPARSESRKEALAILAALALSLIPLRAFLWQPDWTTHDVHSYGVRLGALLDAMQHGQWLGRWVENLDRGYGYPLFSYYPPGFYLLAAGFVALGLSLMPAMKATLTLMQLAGVGGMYGLARQWNGRRGAALAAAVWGFLPYQRVNLFVRGDFAEFAALHWLVVAAWLYWRTLRQGGKANLTGAALAHAAMIVTHTITGLAGTALLALLILWGLRDEKRDRAAVGRLAGAGLLALGFSAFYWAPALLERGLVHIDDMIGGQYEFKYHFLYPAQWLNVFYWGYGVSIPGSYDNMAFHAGLPALAFTVLGCYFAKRRGGLPFPLKAGVALSLILLFFTWGASKFIWDRVPLIRFVQFPWRLLGETGILMALGSASALDIPLRALGSARKREAWTAAALLFVVLAPPWASGGLRVEASVFETPPDGAALRRSSHIIAAVDEFLPANVQEKYPDGLPPRQARIVNGEGRVAIEWSEDDRWRLRVEAPAAVIVQVGQYWFPGWMLERESEMAAARPSHPDGLIEFNVPAGMSEIVLRRGRTPWQRRGDWISLGALLAAMAFLAAGGKEKKAE